MLRLNLYSGLFMLITATSAQAQDIEFETLKTHQKTPRTACTFEIEYPVSGSQPIVSALRTQINEMLGGNYHGDLSDGEALLQHQTTAVMQQLEETASPETPPSYQSVLISTVKKLAETPTFISIYSSNYLYTGGAHGISNTYGITLKKSDGSSLNGKILKEPEAKALKPLLKKGLAAYFTEYGRTVWQREIAEADLADEVFAETNIDNLPLPQNELFLAEDGVVFLYTPYEISSYASGRPGFIIPYHLIKLFLSDDVIALLDKKELTRPSKIRAFIQE